MAEKYTAADFANARFAEHGKEDDPAFRRPNGGKLPWKCACGGAWSDEDMADMDWVPVPTNPTITESQVDELHIAAHEIDGRVAIREAARSLGIKIIPDPEPTNAEKIEELIREAGINYDGAVLDGDHAIKAWAEYLDNNNVYVKDN